MQQLIQETQKNDQQILQVIQNITKAIQEINGKIVKVEQDLGIEKEEQQRKQRDEDLQSKAYDNGFRDAQSSLDETGMGEGMSGEGLEPNPDEIAGGEELPEDLLQGIESLSEEELSLLQMSDPTLQDLI